MGNNSQRIDLSGTHLPVLSRLLTVEKGSVLELGAGYNSTPLLYWTSKAESRYFRSFENYKEWCDKMPHMTTFVDNWETIPIDDVFWGIALIDHRPALRRHKDAIRLKNNARFVVVHDTEPEINRFYLYHRIYPHFKYRFDYTLLKPNTTVLSNFDDPNIIFPFDPSTP